MFKKCKSFLICLIGMCLGFISYILFNYITKIETEVKEKTEENVVYIFKETVVDSVGLPNKIRGELLKLGYKETFYSSNVYKKQILIDPEIIISTVDFTQENSNKLLHKNYTNVMLRTNVEVYKKNYYNILTYFSNLDPKDNIYDDIKKDLKKVLERF